MKNLQRVIDAYTKMDERAKRETLEDVERLALKWPARQEPLLRLVFSNTDR